MGSLSDWISAFRELHERARRGALTAAEQAAYRTGRDELARALLAAQRLTLKTGETPRQALRVARALQLELDLPTERQRSVTIDVSTGGFSANTARITMRPPLSMFFTSADTLAAAPAASIATSNPSPPKARCTAASRGSRFALLTASMPTCRATSSR